ncbi:MAG: hypothetical protein WB784_11500 [Rhodanobacteraceae bacterium]
MILRRIAGQLKQQHWTGVFIELAIVVLGVFIGLQVDNWNQARADQNRLDQQLSAFESELETNLVQIKDYRRHAASQISAINELRATFATGSANTNPDHIDKLLFLVVGIRDLHPELTAYRALADSGSLRRLSGTPLRRDISRWEIDLAWVQRLDRDALVHRDSIVLPFYTRQMSFAAAIENRSDIKGHGFAPSRFRNNTDQLAKSEEFENMLALRFAIEAQVLDTSETLEQSTKALIATLKKREAHR